MLLGLERGERVGPKTLAQVENALGWPAGWTHRFLAGEVSEPPADEPPAPNADVTDDDLLEAISDARRRLAEIEEQIRHRGGGPRQPHDLRR